MKTILVSEIGEVLVSRRKGSKRLVLRVDPAGKIKVSTPWHMPDRTIVAFVRQKSQWLDEQRTERSVIRNDDVVAHTYVFRFQADDLESVRSKVQMNTILILHPHAVSLDDPAVQDKARKVAHKLLKQEAEDYLPERIHSLSSEFELQFANLQLKRLRSRWGSCTPERKISLNTHLMNLPHQLIDHVILHELAHTRHLNHQSEFWELFESMDPHCRIHRKQLKGFDASKPVMA